MPSGEEETVIRNGNFWNWLGYVVVFGGRHGAGYAITGGTRVYGGVVLLVLMAAAWAVGRFV